jgi:hypothetical protein
MMPGNAATSPASPSICPLPGWALETPSCGAERSNTTSGISQDLFPLKASCADPRDGTPSEADRLAGESSYLVLNSGQTYRMTIDSPEPVETFCLFFGNHLAEDIGRVAESGPAWLLDNPVADASDARERTAGVARSGAACSGAPVRFF